VTSTYYDPSSREITGRFPPGVTIVLTNAVLYHLSRADSLRVLPWFPKGTNSTRTVRGPATSSWRKRPIQPSSSRRSPLVRGTLV